MNRIGLAASAAALLALTGCADAGNPTPTPAPTTSASTATATTTAGTGHHVTYTLFGDATRLTYLGQSGNPITKSGPGLGTIYTATLLDGDTARIEAAGSNSNTGLGCTISVDNTQVAKQTSLDAAAGVTCTYLVR